MKNKNSSINTIFSRILILFTIIVVIVVATTITYQFYKSTKSNIEINTSQTVIQANRSITSFITDVMQIGDTTLDYCTNIYQYGKDNVELRLNTILDSRNDIITINFFDMQGNIIVGTTANNLRDKDEIFYQSWFQNALKGNGDYYFSRAHVQRLIPLRYPWVISYSKSFNYIDKEGQEKVGIMLIDFSYTKLRDIMGYATIGKTGYAFIIDQENNIVFHPKQTLINYDQFSENIDDISNEIYGKYYSNDNGVNKLKVIQTIDYTRWRIVGIAFPNEMLLESFNSFAIALMIILAFSILITILIAKIISNYITSPIRILEKQMESIHKETFIPQPIERASLEVKSLSNSFVEMSKRMKALLEKIIEEQELIRKSELDALQAKINPHFLYNTLDSVIWLAEQGDDEGVITLVTALSNLFRISISKGHEVITLEEELEHCRNYLVIQQMRYVDKFSFNISIEEDIKDCQTIKLITQPIVENSIYHGIKYLMDPGIIDIEAKKYDTNKIQIIIKDNGNGMSEEVRKSLLTTDKKKHLTDGNGIGVYNVNMRLKLAFGDEYGLNIESEIEEGTTVTITIPLTK
ncbi:MAG: sensor histidine kinase [Sphaerochaetaceae bacterium]|nr:sensor histidine kinase [Sphaerochaetaceae bacterium]MDC7237228.1 sensor histidine kinase [Sphaerochaetaceae bacterium]MDC7250362.1 sensor histidine kinase [Sphaerochaetaceae bacterium]